MIPKVLDSTDNPKVKAWLHLRENAAVRQKERQVIVFGYKLVLEIATIHTPLCIIKTPNTATTSLLETDSTYIVNDAILKKISGMQTPEPIAAIFPIPEPTDLSQKSSLLICDQIRDPGNLGTLLRTALGLGIEGVCITKNSVDLFNDKALRAAKSATFKLPYMHCDYDELETLIKKNGFIAYYGNLEGSNIKKTPIRNPYMLIVSNESMGPSAEIERLATPITIPMKGNIDSFNVAVAGGILMYELQERACQKLTNT